MGKSLPSFADFISATQERVITDPKDILNDAVNREYILSDMLKGKDAAQVVKSGSKLTERVQLSASDNFGAYDPNDVLSASISDSLSTITAQWRFVKTFWAWTDQEVELNEGDRLTQFKSLRDSKRQDAIVSMYNGMESLMWATPDNDSMEGTGTGGRPYSIRAIVTEDGLAPSGFTNVQGINPSTKSNWRNVVKNYTAASLDTTLVPSMELTWKALRFVSPTRKEGGTFKDTNFNKFKIYTNNDGWGIFARLTRQANDRAINKSGNPDLGFAVGNPMFNGIDVVGLDGLDAVSYTTGQPRFFFLNYEYLFPIFHSKRYMQETDPINGGAAGQPWSWVVYKDTWYNLVCKSRRRQGIVVPV